MKRFITIILSISLILGLGSVAFAANGDKRCEELLAGMSLEEKVGQMIMPAFRYWGSNKVIEINDSISNAITSLKLGGVILFAENTQGTEQTARLIADMQSAALKTESKIPLFMSVDQEGGYIYRLATGTSLCGNMALGASGNAENSLLAGQIIGSELNALGFNVDFAPDMDVNSNPLNPIIGVRSFSDDANLVAEYGSAFIKGLDSSNVIASLKHFPGHGDTATDSHTGLPCIYKSLKEIEKQELIPFKAGIKAGADMIMTAHIQYPNIEKNTYTSIESGEKIILPSTLSKVMITEVLRNKLGFKGVVCSDSMLMDAVAKNFNPKDAAKLAINAGVDILLMPVNITDDEGIEQLSNYIKDIVSLVKSKAISEKTIDEAVLRILKLKEKRGILDLTVNKEEQVKKALSIVGSKVNHDLEWEITEKAITLVKNDGALPIKLSKNEAVALFASYANEVTEAEYAAEKLFSSGIIPSSSSIKAYSYQKMTELSEEQKKIVLDAKAVIISVESAKSWELAFAQDLIKFAHDNNKKVSLISIQLPYDLSRYQEADALIAAYNCKGMNEKPIVFDGETKAYGPNMAVAITACFGAFEPTGKLPVDVPGLASRGFGLNGFIPFMDVPNNAYYKDAVKWAVDNKITSGLSNNVFGPNKTCSRAEAVTFLWRLAGCPSSDYDINFADVSESQYYYNAVKWAAEKGITQGTSNNRFSPNQSCSRAQIVSFLWRSCSMPKANTKSKYNDVVSSAYYADAVDWAAEKGITQGTSGNEFSPNKACSRGQIVSFLYRLSLTALRP